MGGGYNVLMSLSGSMLIMAIVLASSVGGAYLYFAASPSAPSSVGPAPSLQVSQSAPAQGNPQLPQQSQFSGSSHPDFARIAGILQQHPALKAATVQAAINHRTSGSR